MSGHADHSGRQMTTRAELAAIYATLPPTAQRVRIECMTDAEVASELYRWRLRVRRAQEARDAVAGATKRTTMKGAR